ncbi:hypothetical protein JWG42_04925 [Desulfoprunum benzoelyticum]|uniref:Uncharacterized protein n=1 Tax=Desulfoprunum benzoelyticum TaxID=1506996 RepID=A0A840UU66_9BACT|nr:hypothetical protein [Desulfoprunum benzoelyticum]MBB5348313.1 hypothetical protein [Desulfoprunum benzoelyticum]MBM9529496.1 hypothetical protein [Desulfoprunum benzoelyticum]
MNKEGAEAIARDYFNTRIKLEFFSKLPTGLYRFNPEDEILFRFDLFETPHLGDSKYVAVSKVTRQARYVGRIGE